MLIKFYKRIKGKFQHILILIKYHFFTDYYIVSYPKTGNTWVKVLISKYISSFYNIDYDLKYDKKLFKFIKNRKLPRFINIHFAYMPGYQVLLMPKLDWSEELVKTVRSLKGKKVILLTRDPRDIIVSHYHHLKKFNPNIKFKDLLYNHNVNILAIRKYNKAFLDNKDLYKELYVSNFEDRIKDVKKDFLKILNFMNIPVKDSLVDSILEDSTFEKLKKQQDENKLDEKGIKESNRFRKGKAGGYLEECSESEIKEMDHQMEVIL